MALPAAIRESAINSPLPWGGDGLVLSTGTVAELATRFQSPGHEIEAAALESGIHPTRYLRNGRTLSPEAQIKLLRSSVAQVGLGGLGGTLLELFLRSGIGTIRAADGDVFEDSNLNRQALFIVCLESPQGRSCSRSGACH